ncbi:cyclic pyranopterin monophosphate synthase accessory protein [Synergistales bacterium]|nr:cyclic pyranopterin monophosphate synthase accessory protein [Synergistales bacterium]
MSKWTHFDGEGHPIMADVGGKAETCRRAVARGRVTLPDAIYDAVKKGGIAKGNPMPIAEIAGIMGAKRTSDLIPLCHIIKLDSVKVRCKLRDGDKSVIIECEASARGVTGVEMEALTGVSVAALVFYDMCKGIDKGMIIKDIRLMEKSGGKSGIWRAADMEAFE